MAIEETTRVLTRYEADTRQERAEIDKLIAKVDQLKKSKAESARADEQHFDQLVLDLTRSNQGIQEQIVTWDGLHKKQSSMWESFKSGIGNVGKVMTPLNQGMNLAGKAIRFATEGLDAYAKTSPKARLEVEKIKNEFGAMKKAVMEATGEMTVALLKPIPSIDELQKRTERLNSEWRRFIFTGRFGGGADAVTGFKQVTGAVREMFARDTWNTFSAQDELAKVGKAMDEFREKQKRAREEWLKTREVMDILSGLGGSVRRGTGNVERARMSTDEQIRAALGFAPTSGLGEKALANARGIEIDEQKLLEQVTEGALSRFEEQSSRESRFAASQSRRTQSFLEQTLGPIDEFNVYAEAFNMLGGAVSSALNAWVTGSMSAGEAFKKFISEALAGLSSQMAIEALKHAAYAIGSAAFGDVKGAATHSAAAVAFGAGAAAAAVAAKALGGGGSAAPTGAGAGASASGGGAAGGGSSGQPTQTVTNYIIVGDSWSEDSPRVRQQNAERVVELGMQRTTAGRAE